LRRNTRSSVLSLKNVSKHFGGIIAVDNVSFDINPNTITGLIGPNGAGKTTVFHLISGYYKPDSGEIYFEGERIDHLSLHQIFLKGLCRTFQISRELKNMTVLENLMIIPTEQKGENLFYNWIWFLRREVRKQEEQIRQQAQIILKNIGLDHLQHEYAGNLSGGQKRLLELARTMMANPKMILFDEPGAGVNPSERKTLANRIRRLAEEEKKTILLIGHEMELVMNVCSHIIVLDSGRKIMEGTPKEVRKDKRVLEIYLGRTHEHIKG
jgi:branched-chain amino acid transport system ATP-binding protein